ncbi:MAG: hypothetical protein K2O98_12935 [Lachnospiraceae bacterium]|nr:hypothetical protein [Lachnospiraceae bacterium]
MEDFAGAGEDVLLAGSEADGASSVLSEDVAAFEPAVSAVDEALSFTEAASLLEAASSVVFCVSCPASRLSTWAVLLLFLAILYYLLNVA